MNEYYDKAPFKIDDQAYSPEELIELLALHMTKERLDKIQTIAATRTNDIVPVVEHLYDYGNVNAVMRSAEAFGFYNFHIIENPEAQFKVANRIAKGTHKWLNVKRNPSTEDCIKQLKNDGYQIWATHLEASVPIDEVDFLKPTAVVFGNEKEGVSEALLDLADGRFIIPIQGFVQSFNISVAAAISFYHIFHSRKSQPNPLTKEQQNIIVANYVLRSVNHPEEILQRKKSL